MDGITWTPGIGDPTFLGWFTVLAYFLCAYLCLKAFMAEKSGPSRPYLVAILALHRVVRKHWPNVPTPARRAGLWLFLFTVMVALGINKQLDLQSLFTDVGRVIAREQGWYQGRRVVQVAFILALLGAGSAGLFVLWFITQGSLADFRLSFMGLAFLVCFVVVRAASFHNMDEFIGTSFAGLQMNGLLELSGIGLIALGAYLRIRRG